MRLEQNPETRQLVLWTMGEAHADVLLDRLRSRYGVAVDRVDLRVPLRETFAVRLEVMAGTSSSPAVMASTLSATSTSSRSRKARLRVRRQGRRGVGSPAVHPLGRKGVRAQMARGARRRLSDGRPPGHPARRQGAQCRLIRHGLPDRWRPGPPRGGRRVGGRPARAVDAVDVLIEDDDVGAVMGDLSSRRARVLGTESAAERRTLVRAEVPRTQLVRYAIDLRSMSHGTGSFSRTFARYEAMPSTSSRRRWPGKPCRSGRPSGPGRTG